MKVLVTGGAGYIGSITTRKLVEAAHDVLVFDNLERGHIEAVDPRAEFVEGDLRNPGEIRKALAAFAPDAIIHFAGYAYVGESVEEPERYYRNNVGGGTALIEAMAETGVRRIVFSSTCSTYGEAAEIPISEDAPQQPTNPYAETKLEFEQLLLSRQATDGFQPIFLRYFNAAGAGQGLGEDHDPETHLIPLVLQVASGKRDRIDIFGDNYDTPDGTCIRDYIHIEDLAQAHLLALSTEELGAFNLGTGVGHSVREVVETAAEVTGQPIATRIRPRRAGDPPILVANPDKAHSVLGWQPSFPRLETILADAWAWHRDHPQGYRGRPEKGWRTVSAPL